MKHHNGASEASENESIMRNHGGVPLKSIIAAHNASACSNNQWRMASTAPENGVSISALRTL